MNFLRTIHEQFMNILWTSGSWSSPVHELKSCYSWTASSWTVHELLVHELFMNCQFMNSSWFPSSWIRNLPFNVHELFMNKSRTVHDFGSWTVHELFMNCSWSFRRATYNTCNKWIGEVCFVINMISPLIGQNPGKHCHKMCQLLQKHDFDTGFTKGLEIYSIEWNWLTISED